jgi:capping protein alpha
MDDYEEASPEQKLAIANFFVMSSPPGQLDEVLADVKVLVGSDEVLSTDAVIKMVREYNKVSYTQVESDTKKMLVTPFGMVADDEYLDPSNAEVMTINHLTRKASSADKKSELNPDVEAKRAAIEKELKTYMGNNYKAGKATGAVYASDDGKVTICISSMNKKLSSFWSGGWRSTFTLNVSSAGTTDLESNAKIHIHYFEDGNVQLNAEKKKAVQVNVTSDDGASAKAIIAAVSKWESDYQSYIEEMYVEMHTKTFKSMRRFLPKTKTTMDWNPHFHSLASEIGK